MSSVTVRMVLVLCFSVPSVALWGSQAWVVGEVDGDWFSLRPLDAVTGGVGDWSFVDGGIQGSIVSDAAAQPFAKDNRVWVVRASASGSYLAAVDPYRKVLHSHFELSAPEPIATLAIDPTNGEFYGTSEAALYRIDPGTGATTVVGTTSIAVDRGLGFDLLGNLYGVANWNELVEIDKTTGATSLKATLADYLEDIATRPEDGLMYGLGDGPYFFQIDLDKGDLTMVGRALPRTSGLAFVAVTEPSTAGLGLPLLGGLYWLLFRERPLTAKWRAGLSYLLSAAPPAGLALRPS